MTKLDIYHGLLGSGKTTLIKKMLETAYKGHKVAIIENEIGKVNLDAEEFDASIQVKELTSGCVCCTVKGDFTMAIRMLIAQQRPDYIIIEPTGAADIVTLRDACLAVPNITLNRHIMIVNAKRIATLLRIIGPFFTEQLQEAKTIYLNFTEKMDEEAITKAKEAITAINPTARFIDVPLAEITEETFASPDSSKLSPNRKRKAATKLVISDATDSKPARMATGKQQKILTWAYDFQTPFTEEGIQKLREILQETQTNEIWRAKGLLKMQDGTIKKIDAVFGDLYEEERATTKEQKTGTLVLIGKKLDVEWLKKQFAAIEADM